MKNPLTWLSKRRFPYEPLITVEVSRSRLIHNLDEFRKLAPGGNVAPVLKSNAYGHGLVEVAKILEAESRNREIPFLVVDSYFEAIALRSKWIRTPLLVIGYTRPETVACARLKNTAFTVSSMETLRELAKIKDDDSIFDFQSQPKTDLRSLIVNRFKIFNFKSRSRIHLKIDTGMRRQGILPEEIGEAIEILKSNHLIVLEGVCSHLSDADNTDEAFTEEQIIIWNHAADKFKTAFPTLEYFHLSNTDGHRFTADIRANISRLGIGLYGLSENSTLNKELNLLPVMEMKTIITSVKKLKRGETVGYGNTFKAENDMTIATIPVGYYEGIDRRLSNIGAVQVIGNHGNKIVCPIIGRVSMNITVIDVSKAPEVKTGLEVTVISNDEKDPNSISSMAKKCGTITYELTTKAPAQLKRVIVD